MKYLLLLTLVASTLGQERCKSPEVFEGRCAIWNNCPALKTQIDKYTIKELIEKFGGECGGIKNGNILICCPRLPLPSTTTPFTLPFPCTTRPLVLPFPSITSSPIPSNPCITRPTIRPFPITTRSTIRPFPITTRSTIRPLTITTRPVIPTLPSTTKPNHTCANKYLLIGGQCLYMTTISTDHTSWSKSQTQCAQDHGRLAVLQNQDAVARYLKDNNLGGSSAWYWVGANDRQTPGTFRWTTGELVQGTWIDNKPWVERPGQMCVYLTDKGFGRTPCADTTWYICQSK